jgi:hypothetical protein
MALGSWHQALQKTAELLLHEPRRVLVELPEVCRPGGSFDEHITWLVQHRNKCTHPPGGIPLSPEDCQAKKREARPYLEEALHAVRFICNYPLGFLRRRPSKGEGDKSYRYLLHSGMGAQVANTREAYVVETPAPLQEQHPFVVSADDARLLYLWPLLRERWLAQINRHTFYVFEGIPDARRPFLREVRSAAIDCRDEWREVLDDSTEESHGWLLSRLHALPAAPALPAGLRLRAHLLPAPGGKLVGHFLGKYQLRAVIATGGFATVYSAERKVGSPVAVKVLESADARRQFQRFEQEYRKLLQAQEHPGIIRCHEWGNTIIDGREYPWYAMEYALGGDLASRIEERRDEAGQLPWANLMHRGSIEKEFRAIAEAVAHLHGLGIIHRDIKPANVLIMGDGTLRLSDFGLVKDLDPSRANAEKAPRTSTGAVVGTECYMAPEQNKPAQPVGTPADVYALGILLVELSTGQRPKPHPKVSQGSTLKGASLPTSLPAALRRFLRRCTDIRPDHRPENGQAVLDEFTQVMVAAQPRRRRPT